MRLALSVVLALCALSSTFADTRWTMIRTPTLMVIGDQSASTLRNVATEMEQFRAVVGELFPKADQPLALPTAVFVFGQRKDTQPFMPIGPGGKPAQFAGYFRSGQDMHTILMALEGLDEATPIIYHEYTHLLVRGAVRSAPVWLNEGLAEYYSTYTLTRGGKVAEIGRPIARHVALLRERYTPLADLIAVDRTSDLYNEGQRRSVFYAQSWAFVHFLMAEMKDGRFAINRYAAAIGNGAPPSDAFQAAFGSSPAEFDNQLRAYVRRMTFAAQRYTFDEKVAAPTVSAPAVVTDAEASAWLGDLQRRIGRQEEGAKRIEAAAQIAPGSAATQLTLGLLRLDQDRDREGLQALKRAAEFGRDDFTMPFMHGLWLLRTSHRDDVAVSADAIAALMRATELKPDSAEAFAWLAYAQMQQPATLGAARASIERAVELAPGRPTFRIRQAEIIGLQGQYEQAKKLLQEIASATSDPVEADSATASLESMDRRVRREGAEASAASTSAGDHAGLPGTNRAIEDDDRVVPALRKVRPGERREWGLLVRIDCSPSEVRFEVRGGSRTVVTTTRTMEDVDLISYLNEKDFTIACGRRGKPDSVYITWMPAETPDGPDGTAVAVEFLPKGYTP